MTRLTKYLLRELEVSSVHITHDHPICYTGSWEGSFFTSVLHFVQFVGDPGRRRVHRLLPVVPRFVGGGCTVKPTSTVETYPRASDPPTP